MGLIYSDDFGVHQWFLSRIRNTVVALEIHEWMYSTWIILAAISGF